MSHIEIHIDELVPRLCPCGPLAYWSGHRARLDAALCRAGAPSTLAMGGELGRIDGVAFHVTTGTAAEGLGAQVAQAVYGGLRQ